MLPSDHQAAVRRALALGRTGDPAALPELIGLLRTPSNEVQRLAASAIGKLAEFGADAEAAVAALAPLALKAGHPQTQQYAIRALKKCGAAAKGCAQDLRNLARNPAQRDYVRTAAATVADAIEQAASDALAGVKHRCQRCNATVSADEFARSYQAFQRVFCDRCFDEVFLERRNFETQVELNKTIAARDGTVVQSEGERRIAEWLTAHGIAYRYDAKFRIVGEFQIRPDFYLPELDVYIEYWGLDTPQYKMSMYKKQTLYQQEGKRLVSVHPQDLSGLDALLVVKLRLFGFHPGADARSAKESQPSRDAGRRLPPP
ncbi:MAG: HEAT repeat domain-containing protein [Lentisphaerae bacterium]|nr:HEAT repeat domain-containing protein [Lentisphaerota bacterium]